MSDSNSFANGSEGYAPAPQAQAPAPTPVAPRPVAAAAPPDPNAWAFRAPMSIDELLRQLSANSGQPGMPGGKGGDVRKPAFGSTQAPQQNVDPAHYGETGGETTFFNQSQLGGMKPVTSVPGQGPAGWNPLGLANTGTAATDRIKALIAQLFPNGAPANLGF